MLTPRGMHLDPPLSIPGTIDNHALDLNSTNLPPEWTYALDQYKSDIRGNDTLVHRVHKYEINPSNLQQEHQETDFAACSDKKTI